MQKFIKLDSLVAQRPPSATICLSSDGLQEILPRTTAFRIAAYFFGTCLRHGRLKRQLFPAALLVLAKLTYQHLP